MAGKVQRITPFFWFDEQAEEAANFYSSIFPNSSIGKTVRFSEEAARASGRKEGSVMTIDFQLDGQQFGALNGSPRLEFNESISLSIRCETQAEVDYYWSRLTEGDASREQQCGWLKDKFGVSWQVVPSALEEILGDPDPARARRAIEAMFQMKKLDIEALRRAAAG